MTIIELIINIFSVVRLTNLLYEEDGPYNIFEHIRQFAGLFIYQTDVEIVRYVDEENGKYNFFGNLLKCFWCTSLYTGLIVYILNLFKLGKAFNTILALSAIAIIIKEKIIG
jgi:hypothetical protein